MIQRTLDSRPAFTSLLIACTALGCNDERLRELGYTTNPVTLGESSYEPEECEPAFIEADTLLGSIADDVAAAPAESRPFLRYLSLANRVDAGACPEELMSDRRGVTRLLNSVSRAPSVAAPRVGGPAESVLAIDLRDYGLANPVTVEGRSYADGWEAVLGESPYAVELTGDTAASIAEATHTRVPVLNADAFILAASNGPLYYALLGTPPTLGELRASVGLPSELDPAASGALRTALQFSRILRSQGSLRVLDRYSIENGTAGTYWEAAAIDTDVFLSDPLHVQPDVQRLVMYTLPNDLFAFAIFDAAGQRAASGELVLDTNRNDLRAHVLDSCANCHTQGLVSAGDDARNVVLRHPDQFEPEVVAAYEASPSDAERLEQFSTDSAPYQQALASVGIDSSDANTFVARFYAVSLDVSLDTAAADLLVTPEVLRARLGDLPRDMRILGLDFSLSRERFGVLYREAYCALHAGDANPPAAGACASAP